MKLIYKLFSILLLCMFAHNIVLAQGLTCQTATPMCNDITPYPINFNPSGAPTAPAGPNYSCLGSTPNPTYFNITITQSGTIQFDIQNTNVVDIDFILWGPFANLFAATAACSSLGNGGAGGSVIDCSYDPQAFETVNITNAIAGQVYVMMITNFANVATDVFSTPNTGTGTLGCPCQLDANFSIVPLANGTGTMTSSTTSAAEFKVCPGDTLYFNVGIGADNIADTLSIFASLTTIANTFSASQYEIFGPFYPNAPLQDTMDFIVMITPGATQTGIFNFSLGVENSGTSNCFDSYDITVVVPGIPNLPPGDTICSGGTYDLVAGAFPVTASGTNSYTWTQISGPVATITNGNTSTATISPPVIPSGDSMRFQLVYNYGGCIFKDTIKIYGYDIDINMTAAPNPVCAGQPVNLTAVLTDSVGLVVTTSCAPTYTSALTTFAPIAPAGTTVTLGDDQVSGALPIGFSFQYYCNTYTQFYIASNGFITFTAGASSTVYNQSLPNAAQPNNLIALCWTDLDPSSGGTIRYQTIGVAPNRQLIVTYSNVPTYSGGDLCTVQAILKEGSNVIDLHITYAIDDIDFFGFSVVPLTIGMENATGTSAIVGVNSITTSFVQNQSLRITPNIITTTTSSPISYAWTPTATLNNSTISNPIATPTAPTTYHVTIQNGACVFTDSIQVNITGSLPAPTVSCGVSTYTTIPFNWTALALPGGGFYEYSIDGGATWVNAGVSLSATLTGLAPGTTITILVRGNDGLGTACSPGAPGTVTCSTLPCTLTLTDVKEHVVCFGEMTGAIDLTPVNGTPPYNYIWNTGVTAQDLVSLAAGTYSVTVSDAVGCTATSSISVTQPAKGLGLTSYVVNPLCNGANNGCAVVNVAYGTGNYSYNWSSIGMATDSICGLAAGTYTLTVTDTVVAGSAGGQVVLYSQAFDAAHGWTLNVPTGVNGAENNFWTVNNFEAGQPVGTCGAGGGPNQSLHITSDINPTGGAAYNAGGLCGFLFCVETNMRAESPNISTVGQSNITLKFNFISNGDALIDNASVVYSINGGASWLVLNPSIKAPVCPSLQGRWTAFSAVLPATCNNIPNLKVGINWTNNDDGAGTDPSVAIDSVVVFANSAGAGAKYCFAYDTITLTQPTPVAITVNSTTNASCNGGNNGAATVSATGGSGTHSYLWSGSGATTATITGLVANIYTVTVTDTNSCATTQTVTITEPSVLTAAVDSTLSPTCNGTADGAIYIQANGGTTNYTYNWTGGVITQDLIGIPSGTYDVTITDANGCTTTLSQSITQPGAVSVAIDSSSNVSCNGAADAYAAVSGTSGTPGYSYQWDAAAGNQTTATINGLGGGTYVVTISDQNGCTDTVSVVVAEPTALALTDSVGMINCNGDSTGIATLTVTGGTLGYSYMWSNGDVTQNLMNAPAGVYGVTITDANNCMITNSVTFTEPNILTVMVDSTVLPTCNGTADGGIYITVGGGTLTYGFDWGGGIITEDLTAIPSGNYSVTITDANGCITTIDTSITQPGAVSVAISASNNITCNGANNGNATASGSSGIPGYSFVWNDAGAQATATATGLAAGTYIVTISDQNGCTDTISVMITEPSIVTASASNTTVTCGGGNDGTATAVGVGGTGTHSFAWNDASGQTNATATGLIAGTYTVTVTDANGCAATTSVTITEPSTVVAGFASSFPANCAGASDGEATATGTGGAGGYTFVWSAGGQATATATGLPAGTHFVTVTDANGCAATNSIVITEPSSVTASVPSNTTVTCAGGTNGTATAAGIGGSGSGYSFVWSAGGQATAMATGLAAGSYTVTVSDGNGCEGTATVVITEATAVAATNIASGVTCGNVNNGSIAVTAAGGTNSYTYTWDGAASGQGATASNLPAGAYNVTITDSNGCTTTNSATVNPSTPLDSATVPLTVVTGVLDCQLNPVGSLSIVPVSGTGYTYIWSNGATDATTNNLSAGTYDVTITNGSGCTMTQTGTVVAPFVPDVNPFVSVTGSSSITLTTDNSVDIDGGNDQSGSGVSYIWTASSTDITIGNNTNHSTTANSSIAGTYTLTITATSGTAPSCSDAGVVTITYESAFVGMPNAFTPNGDGTNDIFAPIGLNSTEVEVFKVFNRWGQLLYDGSDLQGGGWDGTYMGAEQPSEIYLYLLQYKLGTAESVIIRGEFTLIR